MYIFRQVLLHLLHTLIYSICNFDMIGSRLRDDYHTHHRHTVHLHIALDIGRTQFGTPDITETYDTVVRFLDNQIVEFICGVHQS